MSEGWLRVQPEDADWAQAIEVTVDSISQVGRDTNNPQWSPGQLLLVGGHNPDGASWSLAASEVSELITSGRYQFTVASAPAFGGPPAGKNVNLTVPTGGTPPVQAMYSPSAGAPAADLLPGLPECNTGINYWTAGSPFPVPPPPTQTSAGTPQTTPPPQTWPRYTLTARHSGIVLDLYGRAVTPGGVVQQCLVNGGTNQEWFFVWTGNGFAQLVSWSSGLAVQASQASQASQGQQLTVQQPDASACPKTGCPLPPTTGTWSCTTEILGQCLTVQDASTETGTPVVIAPYSGLPNQQWQAQLVQPGGADATVLSLTAAAALTSQPATPQAGPLAGQAANITVVARNTGDSQWNEQDPSAPLPVLSGCVTVNGANPTATAVQPGQTGSYSLLAIMPDASATTPVPATITATMSSQPPPPEPRSLVGIPLDQTLTLEPVGILWRIATVTLSPTPPASLLTGQSCSFTVTFTNTGTVTWYPQAGYVAQPAGSTGTAWGVGQFLLASPVPPGQSLSWPVTLTAALPVGSKTVGFVMTQSGAAFASSPTYNISVSQPKSQTKDTKDSNDKRTNDIKLAKEAHPEKHGAIERAPEIAEAGSEGLPPGTREPLIESADRPTVGQDLYDPPSAADGS